MLTDGLHTLGPGTIYQYLETSNKLKPQRMQDESISRTCCKHGSSGLEPSFVWYLRTVAFRGVEVKDRVALLTRLLFGQLVETTVASSYGALVIGIARPYVLDWNVLPELQDIWSFDHDSSHATDEMKVYMAVHEPHSGVISSESNEEPALCRNSNDITSRGDLVERAFVAVPAA